MNCSKLKSFQNQEILSDQENNGVFMNQWNVKRLLQHNSYTCCGCYTYACDFQIQNSDLPFIHVIYKPQKWCTRE